MKKLTTLFLTILSSFMFAQIPNPSFETWSGSPSSPVGWWTYNDTIPNSTVKSSTAYAGNYSAELLSVQIGGTGPYYGGGVISGSPSANSNFAVTGSPTALTGWYQLHVSGGDELYVGIATSIPYSDLVGLGDSSISANSAVWKQFTVCILETDVPDSAAIVFELVNSRGNDTVHAGSYALVDDLSWGTCATGTDDIKSEVTIESAYPNPANDFCNIIYSIPNSAIVNVALYDLTGKKLMNILDNTDQTTGRYKIPVNVQTLSNGVYIYSIIVDGVPYTQKLVVAK